MNVLDDLSIMCYYETSQESIGSIHQSPLELQPLQSQSLRAIGSKNPGVARPLPCWSPVLNVLLRSLLSIRQKAVWGPRPSLRMPSIRFAIAFAAAAVLLSAPAASAQDSATVAARKVDRSLRKSLQRGGRTQRVIITVTPGHRGDLRAALESHGDVIESESRLVDTLAGEIHSEDVDELARHPWVEAVSDDATVFAGAASPKGSVKARMKGWAKALKAAEKAKAKLPKIKVPKGKNKASAPAVPATSTLRQTLGLSQVPSSATPTGFAIGVAVVDSGIAPNSDFTGRITGFYDFTRGGVATAAYDDFGHGTHIAGLIGGSGVRSNFEFVGIAPAVNLVGLKVLDETGQGRTSDVIQAIEFVTANRGSLGVQVINLSLGHPIYAPAKNDPLVRAVERATDAGLIVVVSAGNYGQDLQTGEQGYTGVTSPGNAPSAITVGAAVTQNTIDRGDDTVASFSSRGPTWFDGFAKPDVVAPGHQLTSDTNPSSYLYGLLPAKQMKSTNNRDFLQLSGTSMAAGVTSGVVAAMLDANRRAQSYDAPPLTPNAVKAMLEFSTIPLADANHLTQGTGQINAAGAIALASAIDTAAPSGAWWLHSGVEPHSLIADVQHEWSQSVMWGDDVYTGTLVHYSAPAWSLSAQWGDDNIVWGTNDGDNIVWGTSDDNIVWGTSALWATHIVWPDRIIGLMDDNDNIVWGTRVDVGDEDDKDKNDDDHKAVSGANDDNIVWGTLDDDNIVWGTWGDDNIVWGTWGDDDNIVWGTTEIDNIVWGTSDDNIIWGTSDDDNIIWGTSDDDNIVWGTSRADDNIVWGTSDGLDNIVWGTADEDNVIWGTSVPVIAGAF